jgi:signal transduction histidine kinase/CheY-like chemotaxis protein
VPIAFGGRIEGLLVVANRTPRPFTDDDEAILARLADHAASAIYKARLHDESARVHGELRDALLQVEESQQRVVQAERHRALGELAGGVAHDFNNVLAVVVGRAQLLLRQVTEPRVRDQLAVLEQTAFEAARTVRRIHELARTTPPRSFQPIDLNAIVAEVVEVTRPRWRDQPQVDDARCEVRVETTPLPAMVGDPGALREALTHIVLNALDAMPGGGRLRLVTAAHGNTIECVVEDSGGREGDRPRGAGPAPSLVHGIVERHGGEIEVASEVGRGRRVTLRFPVIADLASPAPAVEPGPVGAPRRARILVIDDEPAVRELLRDLLAAEGHAVEACSDGRAGLVAFERQPFEIVVTNLGLPELSGWDVARRVKTLRPATAVALVTGWGDQIEPAQARARGVDYLISKPCRLDDVSAVVARALTREEAAPSLGA